MSDTHNAIKNSIYSIIGYLFPILFTVFITPFMFHRLGAKEYGVMIFVTSIMTVLGLIDGGISTSTVKRLAEYIGQKNESGIRDLIRTANSLFMIMAIAGVFLTGILVLIIYFFFNSQFLNNPEILILMSIVSLSFFVNSVNSIYMIIPNAMQRFDVSTKINMALTVLGSMANLAAVIIFNNVIAIFCAQLIVSIIFFFIWRRASKKMMPSARYSLGWSIAEVRKSISFSFYTIINELSRTALFSFDRIIIPTLIGASSLSYYALAGNMTARIPGVADNLSGVVFPLSANLKGQESSERIQKLYIRSTRLILLISSAITFALAINSYEILRYWINQDVAETAWITLIILAATNFILALLSPVATFLMVFEKWRFYTSLSAIMAIANICLIFVLVPRFGINGAAIAYLLSVLPIFYAIFKLEKSYLQIPDRVREHVRQVYQILATGAAFAIIDIAIIKPFITNLPSLIVLGPLSVIVYIAIYYAFGFIPREDVHDIRNVIQNKIPWLKNRR